MVRARRAFVVTWIVLTVAGALNHTIAEKLVGRRFDLLLPHLKYGHVMFNRNSPNAQLYTYSGADGVRHDLADLMETPAIGYRHARLAISVSTNPDYLMELCLHARRRGLGDLTFTIEETTPPSRRELRCDARGLHP